LRKHFRDIRIHGVDSPEMLERARRQGAVDPGTDDAPDLILLAAPVGAILELLDGFAPGGTALILDVGSTKLSICLKAEGRGLPFLGGHPMAGSEKAGPEHASADLFRGEPFFLCPISTTPEGAIPRLTSVLEVIGAKPCVVDPETHDKVVAQISHLPQILATALADHTSAYRAFAGRGWRSTTRLGGSPFHVWRDILQTSGSLPQELQTLIARLRGVLNALEAGNMKEIEAMFDRANQAVIGENDEESL
jgi:prephenate dehydrogenase